MANTTGMKFGGRQKGTLNKDTRTVKDLVAKACGEDWDPVSEMARIAKEGYWTIYDPDTGLPAIDPKTGKVVKQLVDSKIRARFHEESAGYIHAKRKAVELSGDPNNPLVGRVELSFEGPDDDPTE